MGGTDRSGGVRPAGVGPSARRRRRADAPGPVGWRGVRRAVLRGPSRVCVGGLARPVLAGDRRHDAGGRRCPGRGARPAARRGPAPRARVRRGRPDPLCAPGVPDPHGRRGRAGTGPGRRGGAPGGRPGGGGPVRGGVRRREHGPARGGLRRGVLEPVLLPEGSRAGTLATAYQALRPGGTLLVPLLGDPSWPSRTRTGRRPGASRWPGSSTGCGASPIGRRRRGGEARQPDSWTSWSAPPRTPASSWWSAPGPDVSAESACAPGGLVGH